MKEITLKWRLRDQYFVFNLPPSYPVILNITSYYCWALFFFTEKLWHWTWWSLYSIPALSEPNALEIPDQNIWHIWPNWIPKQSLRLFLCWNYILSSDVKETTELFVYTYLYKNNNNNKTFRNDRIQKPRIS